MIQEMINSRQKHLNQPAETTYFKDNRHVLKKYPFFQDFYFAKTNYEIICANVIIKGLENKTIIEEAYVRFMESGCTSKEMDVQMKEFINRLPQFEVMHQKIIIPFFNRANNLVYYYNILKLGEYPYTRLISDFDSLRINPFDHYGLNLFNSPFTSLMPISNDDTSTCYYHVDYQALFFINEQGSLDFEIKLFDKYIKNPDFDDLPARLKKIADVFFTGTRYQFIDALRENKVLSEKLANKIYHKLAYFYKKRNQVLSKGVSNVEI